MVGDAQVPLAVAGGELRPPTEFDVGVLGPKPVATWRGTALAALAALRTPGALERRATLPEGEIVVADLLGQRVTENLVRGYDIAVGVGRPDPLAGMVGDDLADWCLDFWAGHADAVVAGGVLPAAPIEPPTGSDAWTRLLAFTGRARR